jgi:hypothetical protein
MSAPLDYQPGSLADQMAWFKICWSNAFSPRLSFLNAMWRSPRRFCRHDVLIRFSVRQSFFKKTAMRRGDFPPMCDNAAPRARHRRSVEPALKLLWEASTPDERHQRLHEVR